MLRIFKIKNGSDPLLYNSHSHFLPFDLEKNRYAYTSNLKKANVIPVIGSPYQPTAEQREFLKGKINDNQLLLILCVFHVDDASDSYETHQEYLKNFRDISNNVKILHTNMENKDQIFYDMIWNRQKAYCLDYDKHNLRERIWTWGTTKEMYEIPKLEKINKELHYLSPSRIYYNFADHHRMQARIRLKEVLTQGKNNMKGRRSDPQGGKMLQPQHMVNFDMASLKSGGTWWPVSNAEYRKTITSIYTETVTQTGVTRTITEKTWDPLIKGHFIIPYGYCGMIEDIKNYGFELPNWIDYGYDKMPDDQQRLNAWLTVIKEYLEQDITRLNELYHKDFDMLLHNQRVFKKRPYDSLYNKLIEIGNFRGL